MRLLIRLLYGRVLLRNLLWDLSNGTRRRLVADNGCARHDSLNGGRGLLKILRSQPLERGLRRVDLLDLLNSV